jgi:polyisoprenoid-binding protein YceI
LNRRCLALAVLAVIGIHGQLRAQGYQVDLNEPRHVEFLSEAPIESFRGVTDRIDGYLMLACPELSADEDCRGSEFYFEVDLNSIDTGNGLRNGHMRKNYLETDEFPYATLQGTVHRVTQTEAGNLSIGASARLAIHGVERHVGLSCPVESVGTSYSVRCSLQVSLTDHKIKVPSLMVAKLAETVDLTVAFVVAPIDAKD